MRWLGCRHWRPWGMFAVLFLLYNSDGREIGGYDSQPAKFAAIELASHGTITLDAVVQRVPQYANRPAFAPDKHGNFRSAYSPVPILFGGVVAAALSVFRVPLDAPLAPNMVATLTASLLTAAAVTMVFVALTTFSQPSVACWVAVGLGLGTNYWATVSRTLGAHESVAFGLAVMLVAWTRPPEALTVSRRWLGALGLAIAATARLQMLPAVAVLGLGLLRRVGWRAAAGPIAGIAVPVLALMTLQQYWFGSPLGAMPSLEALHPAVHGVSGSVSATPWTGAAGLLLSPNRGLLIFSPIAAIALVGAFSFAHPPKLGIPWLLAAAGLQFGVYSAYSVWWGGHTFGPRYLLDLLVLLAPSAAVALETVLVDPASRALCFIALLWSIAIAGTGAFCADDWNTLPADVDRAHQRLWDWRDTQIGRAWHNGLSPRNFDLFVRNDGRRAP